MQALRALLLVLTILDIQLIHVEQGCVNDVDSEELESQIKALNRIAVDSYDLVIASDNDCEKIKLPYWKSITVNAGYCNNMEDDLMISSYYYLESIIIKASTTTSSSTLANLNSLTIMNNPLLKSVVVEDGYSGTYGGCINVKRVSLTSMFDLI